MPKFQLGVFTWPNPRVGNYYFAIELVNAGGFAYSTWTLTVNPLYSVEYVNPSLSNAMIDYTSPLTITGTVDSDSSNVVDKDVLVVMNLNGVLVTNTVKTDLLGTYTFTYHPSPQDVGPGLLYVIAPNEVPPYNIISFEVIGLSLFPPTSAIPMFSFVLGKSTSNSSVLTITNLSNTRSVTGLHAIATIVTPTANLTSVNITVPSSLAANATAQVTVQVFATGFVPKTQVDIIFATNEAASIRTTIYVEGNNISLYSF